MLLRASGEAQGERVELAGVTGDAVPEGVRAGAELAAFAEAIVRGEAAPIAAAREAVVSALGEAAMVDAAAVAGNFQRMVRVADGTGIPLDKPVALVSADIREALGLDTFANAVHTPPVQGVQRLLGRGMARMLPLVLRVFRGRPAAR